MKALMLYLFLNIILLCHTFIHSFNSKNAKFRVYAEYNPNYIEQTNTEIKSIFPSSINYPKLIERDEPDYANLPPDSPFFLDMPWPTEKGVIATAYAKHIQWKRRLTDNERLRWQKWAVYTRLLQKDLFKYCYNDYIVQNLLHMMNKQAKSFQENKLIMESTLTYAAVLSLKEEEKVEIQTIIQCYYNIINRKLQLYISLYIMLIHYNIPCILHIHK